MAVTSSKISKTGEHILTASMPVGITCRKNELQAEVDEIIDRSEERKMSMKKIVNPCVCSTYTNRNARAYAKIEFKDGRLSICGVVGPKKNGDCEGSAG